MRKDHGLSEKSFLLSYQEMSAENHTTAERVFNEAMQTLWADDVDFGYMCRTVHGQGNSRTSSGYPKPIHAANALRRFCQILCFIQTQRS
jgi:hypothetical protein